MTSRTQTARRADTRDVPMMVRLEPKLAERVRRLAHEGDRTVSQQLRRLIMRGLEAEGAGRHDPS